MVEHEGYVFYVPTVYERLPKFCSNCYTIGHFVALCNKLHPNPKDDKPKSAKYKEKGDFFKQPITIHDDQSPHDPPKDTEMPSSNALKDATTEHNTNKRSEEVPVANDDDEQDTNIQSEEVPMQIPNSAPAIDDYDVQDNRKVMEDDTHNNNDTNVPEANHASSDNINSEAVS